MPELLRGEATSKYNQEDRIRLPQFCDNIFYIDTFGPFVKRAINESRPLLQKKSQC